MKVFRTTIPQSLAIAAGGLVSPPRPLLEGESGPILSGESGLSTLTVLGGEMTCSTCKNCTRGMRGSAAPRRK